MGCRAVREGFGFRVSGFGFRVSGLGFRVSGLGFRVSGLGFRGWGSRGARVVGLDGVVERRIHRHRAEHAWGGTSLICML